jgi:hypothetical protein
MCCVSHSVAGLSILRDQTDVKLARTVHKSHASSCDANRTAACRHCLGGRHCPSACSCRWEADNWNWHFGDCGFDLLIGVCVSDCFHCLCRSNVPSGIWPTRCRLVRSVSLSISPSCMCLFVPLAIVSVPMTMWRLLIWRHSRPLFAWVAVVLAVCELLCIVAALFAIAFFGLGMYIGDIVFPVLTLVAMIVILHFAFTVVADRAIVLLINEMDLLVVGVDSKLQTSTQEVDLTNPQTENSLETSCRSETESENEIIKE